MLIAILVIVGLSLLILGHEAGHFFAAKAFGLKVHEFGFGFPPRIKAWKKGGTEYSVNWLPFGGFVKIAGERGEFEILHQEEGLDKKIPDDSHLLYAQPAWKKSVVMLAGVVMNFLLGWIFISTTLMVGAPQALIVSGVQPNSPAAQARVAAGDVLQNYKTAQSFIDFVNFHRGQQIAFALLRNGRQVTVSAIPRSVTAPGEGALGVELAETGAPGERFLPALWDGLRSAGMFSWLTLQAFGNLAAQIFGHATLPPGVVGPVGIFGVAEETGKIGLAYLLQFMGIVSLNLMVVNLIPFPALDGGRFLLTVIEKVKGSPLPYKIETWINGLGFAFLILLMVLLTVRDVGSLL